MPYTSLNKKRSTLQCSSRNPDQLIRFYGLAQLITIINQLSCRYFFHRLHYNRQATCHYTAQLLKNYNHPTPTQSPSQHSTPGRECLATLLQIPSNPFCVSGCLPLNVCWFRFLRLLNGSFSDFLDIPICFLSCFYGSLVMTFLFSQINLF